MPALQFFPDREACIKALAGELASVLNAAPEPRTLLLPGGQTPRPLLQRLAQLPLDWSQLLVSPGDERWVAAVATDSNLRLLGECLPQAQLLDPRQAESPELAAARWGALLAARLPLSAVLLGMGDDGHFASLFPGMSGLASALDVQQSPAALVGEAPQEPRLRLSANLSLLLASQWLGVLVFGAGKRALLERLLASDPDVRELPMWQLLQAAGPRLQIWWAP